MFSLGSTVISKYTYHNDEIGRRTSVKQTGTAFQSVGDMFNMYAYNTRSELISGGRYFGADTNDTSNPVGLQDWYYSYDNIGNRTYVNKANALFYYTNNALNQYVTRTIPGSTDVTGSSETNVTVTVNNQGANRQDNYPSSPFRLSSGLRRTGWYKWHAVDKIATSAYEQLNIVGVYSPGGTNEDIVSSVTGNVFVAETPEQFTYDDDPTAPRWLRRTGSNMLTDGRFSYTWDGDPTAPRWLRGTGNRLVSVETLPGLPMDVPVVHVAFDYDYMSRRIGKTVYEWDDASTNWVEIETRKNVYNGWSLIREEVGGSQQATTNWYVHGLDLSGSLSGAGGVGGLLSATFGTDTYAYFYDGNGNVSELIEVMTGNISAHYEYSPFGETIVATGNLAKENKFRFSTKPADDYTKLVLYEYRAYSPTMGRFISRDPIEEHGGINLYMFALNNPLTIVDRLGLCSWPAMEVERINFTKDIPKERKRPAIGLAWLETWSVNVSLKSTDKWYKKDVVVDPSAKVKWWAQDAGGWPEKPYGWGPGTLAELEHVNIYKNWWDSLGSMVSPLTGEYCLPKATCNKALISCYSHAFQWGAEMQNAALDCKGHDPSGKDRDKLACIEEKAYRAMYATWLFECEARKVVCDKLSD